MKINAPAILGSLDSAWVSSKDLNYSMNYVKASLVFFNKVFIDDSELVDSNQMRYAVEHGFYKLVEKGLVEFIKRNNSIKGTLLGYLNRNPPALFSSLDYISNERLITMRRNRELTLEDLYEQFKNSDIRLGLSRDLGPYSEYVEELERLTKTSSEKLIPWNAFGEKIAKFSEKFDTNSLPFFNNRTELYGYIESIHRENPGEATRIKESMKSLADLIYIMNKSYLFSDEKELFIIFDKVQLETIERNLSAVNISLDDVKSLFDNIDIRLVKLNLRSIRYDGDVDFFFRNIVPTDALTTENEDFFMGLERYLEKGNEDERMSYLKFTRKREKYSKVIERRFPRGRSFIEISVLALIVIQLSLDVMFHAGLSIYQVAYLVVGCAVFIDGILGFVESASSKKFNTAFYDKVLNWYREHLESLLKG
ncbi:MAG: hypothetical protein QW046_06185 [Candidatus Micrarchaeaceae archaeon]